ncbi:MAG TPA: AMP-binding protein [Thermomicrobiales bacterium]|nr:AMP-binding protein [Thermomicrobiales bacterium]
MAAAGDPGRPDGAGAPMPVGHDTGGPEIAWRPSAAYLERSRLRRFMAAQGVASFEDLLARAAADPAWFWDAVVKDLDLQFYEPYDRVLDVSRGVPWATWFAGGRYNYVHNALDKHATGPAAGKTALIWEGDDGASRSYTYRELYEETNRLAGALRDLGVGKGDRVGVFLPMLPQTAAATFAVSKLGAIYIPIFSGYGAESVATRLRDGGAKALITADGFYRRGRVVPLKETADAALAGAPEVEHVVVIRRTGADVPMTPGRDHWWDDLAARGPAEYPTERTAAEDLFMIIYTSGTTGRPKGALHTHDGFPLKATQDLAHCFDLQPDDTLFWLTDLGWMMGPWAIIGALTLGATLVTFEGTPDYPHPDRLWELVERYRVTVMGVAPTAVRALMARGDEWPARRDLSSLRVLGSTGEPWNPGPWRWYFERIGGGRCPVINYTGGTEIAGGILSGFTILPLKPASFAAPVPGLDVDVVDDAGNPVRGSVGELVLRGPWPGMTRGFWGDPERYVGTYWSRLPGLWVHGDFAQIDDDGFWYILGRSDDTIKVAGKRVGPAEVESAAVAHPAVQEAAAVGVPHPVKGDVIVVFAVLRPGREPSEALRAEVEAAIADRLGRALKPEAVKFVGDLPKTRNAKVMRRVIRAAYLGQDPGDVTALENPAAVEDVGHAR